MTTLLGISIATTGKIYVADLGSRRIRVVDIRGTVHCHMLLLPTVNSACLNAGFCPDGYFPWVASEAACQQVPAGYFRPRTAFNANYYICGAGYYSLAGSTACSACPSSTAFGATSCCPAGTYGALDACVLTPAGRFYV
jgi:hypothetical protein